jgi:hypothetical protein
MSKGSGTVVVGFDLGHGETAVTVANAGKTAPPTVLDLPGSSRRQHVTAVAEHATRGVIVGEEAAYARDVSSLYLAFKAPDLDREDVKKPIKLFVGKIRDDIVAESMLPKGRGAPRWVFGAPSGWSPELREKYAKLLKSQKLAHVEVTPESRAALLYARDSGEVEIDADQLKGAVLIVDIGSSTTDFTSVIGQHDRPIDQGTQLGANLIDKMILERELSAHPQREAIEETIHRDRYTRLRLELTCRKAKEEFFRTDPSRFEADPETVIYASPYAFKTEQGNIIFMPGLTRAAMDEVLDTPLAALDDRSWRQVFREDLTEAGRQCGKRPDLVLLTGGASRMRFTVEIARDVFGTDRIILGAEPEVAIARGLAIAGRMSLRVAGFRADVARLLDGPNIASLVSARLPTLAEALGKAATDGLVERHVVPAFRRWREGRIETLDGMTKAIVRDIRDELASPENPQLVELITEWQNDIRPELEELTRPICLRWDIPPAAMTLPEIEARGNKLAVAVDARAATEMLDSLGDAINLVVAGIVGAVLIVVHAALIAAAGPVGILVAVIAAAAGGGAIKDNAMEKATEANIPVWLRKVRSEQKLLERVRGDATVQEAKMASSLAAEFLKDVGPKLVEELAATIAHELEALANDAELLIS